MATPVPAFGNVEDWLNKLCSEVIFRPLLTLFAGLNGCHLFGSGSNQRLKEATPANDCTIAQLTGIASLLQRDIPLFVVCMC